MVDIFAEFTQRVAKALNVGDAGRISVELPRDASHGDLATNAALVLSKDLGKSPREIAGALVEALKGDANIVKTEIAGPGFVNITLSPAFWQNTLQRILDAGGTYGRAPDLPATADNTINIEFVSANPTGPLHIAHARGAVFGDVLANVLQAAGHPVTREYYINDAGAQVDVLARSVFLRYREALGEAISIPAGLYPGDYLKPVGALLAQEKGAALLRQSEEEWLPFVRAFAVEQMMALIRADLDLLGITHDVFFSERSLQQGQDQVRAAIDALAAQGLIYKGVLPRPKGDTDGDWEEREQTLFRSTDFGDDVDRPLMKSDGSYTYFASDIAYHYIKARRGAHQLIDVLGADHGGYVKRVQAAVTAITRTEARLDVRVIQLVRLLRDGTPVKMSKRAGDFVTLRAVAEEVGADAVRFMMLMRKNDAPLDFDLAKVREQSKDNPVFYVQYAHARLHSVFRQAAQTFPGLDGKGADLSSLNDVGLIEIIKILVGYPKLVAGAAAAREPHRIAFYLFDLAGAFHSLWNRGKDLPSLRFIKADDREGTRSHLALLQALATVLKSGLSVLGVSAPEEMR